MVNTLRQLKEKEKEGGGGGRRKRGKEGDIFHADELKKKRKIKWRYFMVMVI